MRNLRFSNVRAALCGAVGAAMFLVAGGVGADVWDDKDALRVVLSTYSDRGHMLPVAMDTDSYLHRDIQEALAMAHFIDGDECIRAVRLALYLDAHRLPDTVQMVGRLYDNGLLGDLTKIWVLPDEDDKIEKLAWGWGKALWSSVDGLDDLVLSYDAFVAAANEVVRANRDLWVQEVVETSLRSGWDANQLAHANARLDHQMKRAGDWLFSTEQWSQARLNSAEAGLERDLKQAQVDWENARNQLRQDLGDLRFSDNQDQRSLVERLKIENAFFDSKAKAHSKRAATIAEVWKVREGNLLMAMQDFAKARIQKAALMQYTVPMIAGQCETLGRAKAPLSSADDG